jgi:hypothetical protein
MKPSHDHQAEKSGHFIRGTCQCQYDVGEIV